MKKYKESQVREALQKYIKKNFKSSRQAALSYCITPAYMYYILDGQRGIPDEMLADIGFEGHTERYYVRVNNG